MDINNDTMTRTSLPLNLAAIKKLVLSIEEAATNGESEITVTVPGGYHDDVTRYLEQGGGAY